MQASQHKAGISLLFTRGERPSASDVDRLLANMSDPDMRAAIGHHPGDDHGWIEVVVSGLVFELSGLAPGPEAGVLPPSQVYGLPADVDRFAFEAITLRPGAHIARGAAALPILRTLMSLSAHLALQLPITAVCWNPAQSWMEPRYFGRMMVGWLSGGPFPVLGLMGVTMRPDGYAESTGLSFFTGQEISVMPRRGDPGSETIGVATRVMAEMVANGPIDGRQELCGIDPDVLLAVPSSDGGRVTISRP